MHLDRYCVEHAICDEMKSEKPPDYCALYNCTPAEYVVESTSNVLADTFEALVGAIFLDCGSQISVISNFATDKKLLVNNDAT